MGTIDKVRVRARASVPRDSAAQGTTTVNLYRRKVRPTRLNTLHTEGTPIPDYTPPRAETVQPRRPSLMLTRTANGQARGNANEQIHKAAS